MLSYCHSGDLVMNVIQIADLDQMQCEMFSTINNTLNYNFKWKLFSKSGGWFLYIRGPCFLWDNKLNNKIIPGSI